MSPVTAPRPLAPGARIGVFSPSGAYDPKRLEAGIAWLEAAGYQVLRAPNLGSTHRYLAGTDAQRRDDLAWALQSPDLDGAWMARGGYGLARICQPLPLPLDDRPVLGFSDGTALHAALWRVGKAGVHAPVLHSTTDHADPASRARALACLRGAIDADWTGQSWIPGGAQGPLVGGNLCMLASIAGTPLQPDLRGCVLLLEEIAEPPYKLDRMLHQLMASGMLDGVVALALGEFVGTRTPEDWTLRELLTELLEPLGVPVIAGLPVGHGHANHAFVWGQPATLEGDTLRLGTLGGAPPAERKV